MNFPSIFCVFSCFWYLCISKLYWNQLWVVSTVHLVYWALFLWRYLSCFVTVAINPASVFAETWFPFNKGQVLTQMIVLLTSTRMTSPTIWLYIYFRTRPDSLWLIISVFVCPLLNNDNIAALRCSLLSCIPSLGHMSWKRSQKTSSITYFPLVYVSDLSVSFREELKLN